MGQERNGGRPAVGSGGSSGLEVLLGERRSGTRFSRQGRQDRKGESEESEGKGGRGQMAVTLHMRGNS